MGATRRLWLFAGLWQVVSLTCEQHSNPAEVEVEFLSFPLSQDPDSFTVTCSTATNSQVHVEPIHPSSCSPACRTRLQLVEDQRGYNITLSSSRNGTTLKTKSFHFIPAPLSSFRVHTTTTSALLTWKLPGKQTISSLSVWDTHTHTPVTHTLDLKPAEVDKSQHLLTALQPGSRFKVKVTVTTALRHLGVTLKQTLSIAMETAQCPSGWLAQERSCYSVRRRGLTWADAQRSCGHMAAGAQLVDLRRRDHHFLFVSAHLQTHSPHLLLLWTALTDQREEGRPLWSDGSSYNQTVAAATSLVANQTDCFALQRNATGPGYFLTPFFCHIHLPYICQYTIPQVPASFSFHLAQVTEHQVELRWTHFPPLASLDHCEIFLQYQSEEGGGTSEDRQAGPSGGAEKMVRVPGVSLSSRGVTVAGLSPGSVYSFRLAASHPAGSSWSLAQTLTAYTRPLPPQNVTVGSVTVGQMRVHWMVPQPEAGWTFVVRYVDVSSGQERTSGVTDTSWSSLIGGLRSYSAVIGGLASHRKYMVRVYTVTRHGIESCGHTPVAVQTALRAPSGLVVLSTGGNLTVCWTRPHDDPSPDGYYITARPLTKPSAGPLWINQTGPGPTCVDLGLFTPGQTYEVGVEAVKEGDRSRTTSATHTTDPFPVQVAVLVSVGATSAQLYVQSPQLGLSDGVTVCVCPGVCYAVCEGSCVYVCEWFPLPAGDHTVTVGNLSPGSRYQLRVHSSSQNQTGPPYYTRTFKTSLVPPSRVRGGVVTHSSIQLLWDPAPGAAVGYEVVCLNCETSHMVQKVSNHSAVFSALTPGKLYHFTVRAEKESFTDSSPVPLNITAAPSSADVSLINKTTSSICIGWRAARGVTSSLILSIKNTTSCQELITSDPELRSHSFKGLAPGSQYTISVICTSGEKKSEPATMTLYTMPEAPQEVCLSERRVTSVFVTWRAPPGRAHGYKLSFGALSSNMASWVEAHVPGTSYEVTGLIPGSDYGVNIQSLLGSDTSLGVHREFSTRPAGVCGLRVGFANSSSFSASWDAALGNFDFYRVTVADASNATRTLTLPGRERVAVVTGLLDGCGYNVSVERVRGETAGEAASLTVTTAPARVAGLRVVNVSSRGFSLRWEAAAGCVDLYQVSLQPKQGQVTVQPGGDGYIQAEVVGVSPATQFTVTVAAVSSSSSNISPGISRMISTNESVPSQPLNLEGEPVGSNGILLSWFMPGDVINENLDDYLIRYKEVCPYPDATFTQVTKTLEIPEVLITDFTSGSTYHIQVAAINQAGMGPWSKSMYIKTAESPPGLVTNLTAYSQNHTSVMVTWYLPHRINGLINKFAVKAKHARTGQTVRMLEVNAEDIMTVALPHCNDAADILSRATLSPLEITASSPPITLSAVPPAASWSVPISVGVDQLRPYTAYLFEVSAFTSDGEGQIASTMVRMPESAPEDAPQNFVVLNMTSRSISVAWSAPKITTGRFSYVLYLYGPTGFLYENSTGDMRFAFTGLIPFTSYTVAVRAKAAGEVGPAAEEDVLTPAEAPSAVQDLVAEAEDSVSIRVSWKSPAQRNGPIIQYRLQVLVVEGLLQDITLIAEIQNGTQVFEGETAPPDPPARRRRAMEENALTTSPPTFTATVPDRSLSTGLTPSPSAPVTDTDAPPTLPTPLPSGDPSTAHTPATAAASPSPSHTDTVAPSSDTSVPGTTALFLTSELPATPPPWLTQQTADVSSDSAPVAMTTNQQRVTRDVSVTGHCTTALRTTRSAATSSVTGVTGTTGVTVKEEVMDVLSEDLSYLVSDLNPFTEYTFRVTASTTVGEGPASDITEKTREQVPSSVLDVSYQNLTSTSIEVNWVPPLNPNGRITHFSVYGVQVHDQQELMWTTNTTSIVITDLEKYSGYLLRVAASTAVGESELTEEDDLFVHTLEDEPDSPPENLTVVDTSPSTVTLAWSPPERANGVIQRYTLSYENESFSASVDILSNRATLTKVKPFSRYNASVRAYTRFGHGNQTSETLDFLSGEDVPGSAPFSLSYASVTPSEVNVTWQPPLLPNGLITHYSLELWNSTHYLNLTSPVSHILITHLRKYAHYRLKVAAHTRVGPGNHSSEPLNITTLQDAPDTPPQFLHARKLSDYEVELSWQPPVEANSEILYYVVRVWNETSEQWQNVTDTSVVIHVDSESQYNASVSSWTRLGDGGVLVHISFTTTDAEPFDPPQNVTVTNVNASSITLQWEPPTEPNGIIVHYSIYYSYNYTVTEQRLPVSDLPPNSPLCFTLTGLMGGANYTVWMTSSTVQGDGGVQSDPLTLVLPEDVPSDSVVNLTAQIFSSTTVIVSWEPPLEPNGRLYYLITLQEAGPLLSDVLGQGSGPAVNKTIRGNTTDNVFLFTKLRKYFLYVATVTPGTGAGAAYNHTSALYLRTDDDIPSSPPLLVSTRNLSSSAIAVAWQRPLETNGEVSEYSLVLYGPGGSSTAQTSNTSFVLTNLLPYTAYNLTVTAATRKGSGPHLLVQLHTDEGGPMSPPRNLSIYNHTAVSVWLTWDPPLEPNGVVIQYGFLIQDLITHTVTHQNSSGPSTTDYLTGFRPHSSYEISVYSFTRVGHGNQFSLPVTFTTNESVSDAVGNLSCSGLSWDSVLLSWELPVNPNGEIVFYEITVEADEQSYSHQAHAMEFTVSGLTPDRVYSLTVEAVNSAGPGETANCTAVTLAESVPSAPRSLAVSQVSSTNVTLQWAPPRSVPGLLREYHIIAQLLAVVCETNMATVAPAAPEDELTPDCVDSSALVSVNSSEENPAIATLRSLYKYRYYRFKVAAVTNAGAGEFTRWSYAQTLVGDPDLPPRDLSVTSTSSSLRIAWVAPAVLTGPTSYLVQVETPGWNVSMVRAPGELMTVVVTNLTAFTRYHVTVTAFTGPLELAASQGKAIGPEEFLTLEEEPKDPPKNVIVSVIPQEVNRVKVTFTPPAEPNGNITAYFVYVYEKERLVKNISLDDVRRDDNNTLTAVIAGLKGGHNYSIQISARNGAGRSPPSPHVQITTGIKAPAKPTQRPQAVLGHGGVAMVTHRSITIRMPACFYSDNNGPIMKIQVVVAESGVKDILNLTNWKTAFFGRPGPYLTDKGFPNPPCPFGDGASRSGPGASRSGPGARAGRNRYVVHISNRTAAGTYVIGNDDSCMNQNNTDSYCNGPLKSNTVYVFKFRATNINGQFTDTDYSDHVKTAADGLLTREVQIILGVVLSSVLALLLIIIICLSVKLHQRKKEGGTYSPREAEIIETKCKLDQLIAVADLELKQEKLNRYSSFFFRRKEIYVIQLLSYRKSLKPVNKKSFLQHVEDLCANDNAKFQEEFAALPKLLQDLATTDADMPCNKSKNRFPNIKPYNNNRVKLLSEPGTAGSDYINASFVSGYLCPNEFIATQGPLPGTVADFWRMIWETGTHTIAMLSQCFEKGRIRCHKYWPEDNKPMSVFGDILISKVSQEVHPDWTVRTLRVEKHGHCMLVRHFNYTSWPEHGVPESCSTFIKFVKAVRSHRHDNTTIAVHCSAGVGRTGVFMALDHLIQHVRDHDFVDIYGLVAELRSERMCMVQNLAQYIFLHQSTLELLNNKGNSQSIWFVSYSALEKMDSLDTMEGDVELEWEETTM